MALINCPNCGAQISDRAPQCPHCGYQPSMQPDGPDDPADNDESDAPHRSKALIWTAVVLAIIVVAGAIALYIYIDSRNKADARHRHELLLQQQEKARRDSIDVALAAELEARRQDSIARRNFTTPDLAFNELHGHVEKCEWSSESRMYYPSVFSYNYEGVLADNQGEYGHQYTRNKDGQIIVDKQGYNKFSYRWSDNKIKRSELEECEGETAYGGGATHYFYDADGLLAYTTTDDGEGEDGKMRNMKTVYSDYQFDEMGNWISRASTTTYQTDESWDGSWQNHTDTDKEVRVITYYDSDIGKDRQDLLSKLHEQRVDKIQSDQKREQEEAKKQIPGWIQGLWHLDIDGPNGISVANYTLTINANNATFVDGRTTKYRGECHVENGKLYLGSSICFSINTERQSLYYSQYRLTKEGGSSSWSGGFRTDGDVMSYLTGRTFYSDSHRMGFTYNSVTIDGYTVSGAPRIRSFSSSSATIVVYPLGGGSAVTLYLNASNGTINYDGDIFRAR